MVDPSSSGADRPANLDQNIDSVLEVRKREREQRSGPHRLVDRISRIMGRPLYLLALFSFAGIWIAVNLLAPRFGRTAFDPSPFPLLDGILSLAALVTTTVNAKIETVKPICDSLTPRPALICGSRPVGSISSVTEMNTATARVMRAKYGTAPRLRAGGRAEAM